MHYYPPMNKWITHPQSSVQDGHVSGRTVEEVCMILPDLTEQSQLRIRLDPENPEDRKVNTRGRLD